MRKRGAVRLAGNFEGITRDHFNRPIVHFRANGAAASREVRARAVIGDLHALTRAILHPADRVAWLSVLRAPWCGLTLADLSALAGDDHRATVWTLMCEEARVQTLSADGARRLTRVRGILAEFIAARRRESEYVEETRVKQIA